LWGKKATKRLNTFPVEFSMADDWMMSKLADVIHFIVPLKFKFLCLRAMTMKSSV